MIQLFDNYNSNYHSYGSNKHRINLHWRRRLHLKIQELLTYHYELIIKLYGENNFAEHAGRLEEEI